MRLGDSFISSLLDFLILSSKLWWSFEKLQKDFWIFGHFPCFPCVCICVLYLVVCTVLGFLFYLEMSLLVCFWLYFLPLSAPVPKLFHLRSVCPQFVFFHTRMLVLMFPLWIHLFVSLPIALTTVRLLFVSFTSKASVTSSPNPHEISWINQVMDKRMLVVFDWIF